MRRAAAGHRGRVLRRPPFTPVLQRAVRSAAVGDAASALVRHLPRRAPGRGRLGRSPREPRRPCFPSFADGASAPPAEARSPPPCTCRHTRLRRRAERPSGEQPTTTASASSATTGHGASGDDDIPTPAHETRRPSSARRSPTGAERRPPVQLRERSHPVAPVRGRRRRTVRSRIAAVRSLMDVSFRRARRAVSPAVSASFGMGILKDVERSPAPGGAHMGGLANRSSAQRMSLRPSPVRKCLRFALPRRAAAR